MAATTQVRLLVWTLSWVRRCVVFGAWGGRVLRLGHRRALPPVGFRGSARLVSGLAARDLCAFGLRAASWYNG